MEVEDNQVERDFFSRWDFPVNYKQKVQSTHTWKKPLVGQWKLNTDRFKRGMEGGIHGIFRECNGLFHKGLEAIKL